MCTLDTERLILRRFTRDDGHDLYEYLSREDVVKYEPYDPFDLEECKREAENRSENDAFWAVCLKEGGKLIGNIYYQRLMPMEYFTWEIGYVFNPVYYGRGYATEACRCILQYGFQKLGAHRVIAHCNPENGSSWRLLERLLMRREGHHKQAAFFKRNQFGEPIWHDAYGYAILADEWFAL